MYDLLFFQCRFSSQLLLSLLLCIVYFAVGEDIVCSEWNTRIYTERAPYSSDCRRILSHMPNIRHLSNARGTLSLSSPFFPSAQFTYGSCIIVVELIGSTPYTSKMRKVIALQGWQSMIAAAANIITLCVDNRQPGTTSNLVGDSDQVYAVLVERSGWYPVWTNDQRRTMDDKAVNETHPQFMGHHSGLFRRTIYHI